MQLKNNKASDKVAPFTSSSYFIKRNETGNNVLFISWAPLIGATFFYMCLTDLRDQVLIPPHCKCCK